MFDPSPGFPEAMTAIAELHAALEDAVPQHVVCLSTIGAQVTRDNLLSQLRLLEEALSSSRLNVTFLRAAWFMENYLWDVPAAKENGVVQSFLQPLERAIPMVATDDIGELTGALLQEPRLGFRRVQLEGPAPVSPNEVAEIFGQLLGKSIRMEAVPRDHWEETFRSQGMKNPVPRIQMLDGFNEGWIRFEDGQESRRGSTAINTVIACLAV